MKSKDTHRGKLAAQFLTMIAATLIAGAAIGQQFPTKPIRMILPYSPGGSGDLLVRTVADSMSKSLGQPVIVDPRPGAGGIVGADLAAKAAPDGYTLTMVAAGIVTINQSIYKKLPFDPLKDFTPLTIAVRLPLVTVVNSSLPIRTSQDLLTYARANPGKLTYGSAGTGSSQHLAGELLQDATKIQLQHIPYKGGAPAMNDLLGGHISMMFVQVPSALPQLKTGKVRAISIGSAKRSGLLPDVPTMAETGLPGYNSDTWYGFLMPAGVPPAIASKLHAAIVAALNENTEKLTKEGYLIEASSQQEMAQVIKNESAMWSKVIRAANIEAM